MLSPPVSLHAYLQSNGTLNLLSIHMDITLALSAMKWNIFEIISSEINSIVWWAVIDPILLLPAQDDWPTYGQY